MDHTNHRISPSRSFTSFGIALKASRTPACSFSEYFLSGLSLFERDIISTRTKASLEAARARGRKGGRPKGLSKKAQDKAQDKAHLAECLQRKNIPIRMFFVYLSLYESKTQIRINPTANHRKIF
ncbi:MAG: recombinase family protein [Chitinophagales bacterium]|nr:recombinase family protein [Chitinophagales bacterium]